jgi:hypothetical protein
MGRLIPAGTGLAQYRELDIMMSEAEAAALPEPEILELNVETEAAPLVE